MSESIEDMLANLTEGQKAIYELMLEECGYADGAEVDFAGSAQNDLAHERAAVAMWWLRRAIEHNVPDTLPPSGGYLPGDRVLIGSWPGTVQSRSGLVPVKLDAVPYRIGEFPAGIVKELGKR